MYVKEVQDLQDFGGQTWLIKVQVHNNLHKLSHSCHCMPGSLSLAIQELLATPMKYQPDHKGDGMQ